MAAFISKAEETFQITSIGCVVVPGLPRDASGVNLKVGDPLVLKRPDGSEIVTTFRGFMMGSRHPSGCVPICLGKEIGKEMVPPGTELWTTE